MINKIIDRMADNQWKDFRAEVAPLLDPLLGPWLDSLQEAGRPPPVVRWKVGYEADRQALSMDNWFHMLADQRNGPDGFASLLEARREAYCSPSPRDWYVYPVLTIIGAQRHADQSLNEVQSVPVAS